MLETKYRSEASQLNDELALHRYKYTLHSTGTGAGTAQAPHHTRAHDGMEPMSPGMSSINSQHTAGTAGTAGSLTRNYTAAAHTYVCVVLCVFTCVRVCLFSLHFTALHCAVYPPARGCRWWEQQHRTRCRAGRAHRSERIATHGQCELNRGVNERIRHHRSVEQR